MIHMSFVNKVVNHLHICFVLCVHDLYSLDLAILSYCCCEGFNEDGKKRRREWTSLSGPLVQCKAW